MKKIIVVMMTILILLSYTTFAEEVARSEIDYTNPESIASAPPSEIDVTQAVASGNGGSITLEQWTYEDNLNLVTDLSLYSNAQEAVESKHSGLTLSLGEGHVSYRDGTIQNGEVMLDLTDENIAGTIITALDDGGFLIEKGSAEEVIEIQRNNIELNSDEATAEVRTNNQIILGEGAILTDAHGTKILSMNKETEILIADQKLIVKGIAQVRDAEGSSVMVGDFGNIVEGVLTRDYANDIYVLETTSVYTSGASVETEKSDIEAENILFLDARVLNGAAGTIRTVFGDNLQEFCNQDGCIESASYTSMEDITKTITAKAESYYQIAENELGMSKEAVTTLGVAGVIASGYLPSEKKFETKDGKFSAVLGYTRDGFTPFVLAQYENVQIKAEPNVALSSTDGNSLNAITTSPTQLATVSTHLDLEQGGTVDVSISGSNQLTMSYQRQVGSVYGSVSVYKTEDMEGIFLNLDLSRIIN